MKIKLHVCLSTELEDHNEYMHTGVMRPARTLFHEIEIEVPDPPKYFALSRITIANESEGLP